MKKMLYYSFKNLFYPILKFVLLHRLTLAMAFTVITFRQTRLTNRRCGQKHGLDGNCRLSVIFSVLGIVRICDFFQLFIHWLYLGTLSLVVQFQAGRQKTLLSPLLGS